MKIEQKREIEIVVGFWFIPHHSAGLRGLYSR